MTTSAAPTFTVQRLYIRDSSFESPHVPEIFLQDWKPEVDVDLQTKSRPVDQSVFEVVLMLSVTVKNADKIAFCVEAQQAGIFVIDGFEEDAFRHVLGSLCPNILYPYAREIISSLITHGGFPALLLAPVNFDALYRQHAEKATESPEIQVVEEALNG